MPDSSLRRLALADLDEPALRALVRHGESSLVERKRDLPKPPRFGAAAASFANTLGGWILLGVDDDGSVHGYEKPDKLDLQSHLAAVLRQEVDPLPPILTAMRTLGDRSIGVVRVFESADAPHIVRGTGAVYLRTSKGKEPIDDHQVLLALARRGREAEAQARQRLKDTRGLTRFVPAPDTSGARDLDRDEAWFVMRAAPLTVTPAFSDWALTRAAAAACVSVSDMLIPGSRVPYAREEPHAEPHARGIAARGLQELDSRRSRAAVAGVDASGVVIVGQQLRFPPPDPNQTQAIATLNAIREDHVAPLLQGLTRLLHDAETVGRVAVDFWLRTPHRSSIQSAPDAFEARDIHVERELVAPDPDLPELVGQIDREIQRNLGIVKFEGEPGA